MKFHQGLANLYKVFHHGGKRHIRSRPVILPIAGVLFGVLIVIGVVSTRGSESLRPSDSHVVFLFDAGKKQTLNTKATTVGELVEKLPLKLVAEDVVEPSADTPIVEDNFRINVYRARPVTVVDKDSKIVTLTAQKSPRVAAQKAGLKVYAEDKVSFAPGSLKDNIIGEQVVLSRATPVALNLYGKPVIIRTHTATVADMLKEKNITPAKGDTLKPAADTPISSRMQIFLTRLGTKLATVEEAIPAPVEIIQDSSLSFGTSVVRQEGSPGIRSVTYQINMKNGRETGRTVIQQAVIEDPVPRVVARGTVIAVLGNKAAIMSAAGIKASDQGYANFIISRESNWRPNARNASGCLGLGQACPGSKLTAVCPDLNAVCQMRFFSGYAEGRYGSWGGAYNAWQSKHWW